MFSRLCIMEPTYWEVWEENTYTTTFKPSNKEFDMKKSMNRMQEKKRKQGTIAQFEAWPMKKQIGSILQHIEKAQKRAAKFNKRLTAKGLHGNSYCKKDIEQIKVNTPMPGKKEIVTFFAGDVHIPYNKMVLEWFLQMRVSVFF